MAKNKTVVSEMFDADIQELIKVNGISPSLIGAELVAAALRIYLKEGYGLTGAALAFSETTSRILRKACELPPKELTP